MTDMDFEIIESSSIEMSRSRKPKYKHKVWETSDSKDEARYMLAVSRINARRNPEYANELLEKIDKRYMYEIELESVFLPQSNDSEIESDTDSTSDDDIEVVLPELNSIVNVEIDKDIRVVDNFVYHAKRKEIVAEMPCGVVTTKVSLRKIYESVCALYLDEKKMEKLSNEKQLIVAQWFFFVRDHYSHYCD